MSTVKLAQFHTMHKRVRVYAFGDNNLCSIDFGNQKMILNREEAEILADALDEFLAVEP